MCTNIALFAINFLFGTTSQTNPLFAYIKLLVNAVSFTFSNGPSNPQNKTNWLKVFIAFEYMFAYFFMYTRSGNFIFTTSLFVVFTTKVGEVDTFIAYWCFVCIILASSSVLNIYLLVQFKYTRDLLIDCIGVEDYARYIGVNPGSNLIKRLGLTIGGVLVAGTLSNEHTHNINWRKAEAYKSVCTGTTPETMFNANVYATLLAGEGSSSIVGTVVNAAVGAAQQQCGIGVPGAKSSAFNPK